MDNMMVSKGPVGLKEESTSAVTMAAGLDEIVLMIEDAQAEYIGLYKTIFNSRLKKGAAYHRKVQALRSHMTMLDALMKQLDVQLV